MCINGGGPTLAAGGMWRTQRTRHEPQSVEPQLTPWPVQVLQVPAGTHHAPIVSAKKPRFLARHCGRAVWDPLVPVCTRVAQERAWLASGGKGNWHVEHKAVYRAMEWCTLNTGSLCRSTRAAGARHWEYCFRSRQEDHLFGGSCKRTQGGKLVGEQSSMRGLPVVATRTSCNWWWNKTIVHISGW